MNKIIRVAVGALCALFSFTVVAASVTSDEAAQAVGTWIGLKAQLGCRLGASVAGARTCSPTNGVSFHVVKLSDGGFVVTSADTEIEPILAFSESDDLVESEKNPLWTMLRRDLAARGSSSRSRVVLAAPAASSSVNGGNQISSFSSAAAKWARLLPAKSTNGLVRLAQAATGRTTLSDVRVAPLLETKWSQQDAHNYGTGDPCYNYYTPENYPCGCVATAGAQIMRYHRYPTASVTPATYACEVMTGKDWISQYSYYPIYEGRDLTMQGGIYSWDSMPLVPADGVTLAQRQAIGKLTSDVGITCLMSYAEGGSSSGGYMLSRSLPERFGYANAVAACGNGLSSAFVRKVLVSNLDAKLPVMIGLDGSSGGHAVVADGYGYSMSTFYAHFNMGWAGTDDAWYAPPNVADDFYAIDTIVYNIYPTGNEGGVICSGRILSSSGSPVAGATVAASGTATATTTSDANGIYSFILSPGSYTISSGDASQSATLVANVGTPVTENGYYRSNPAPAVNNVCDLDLTVSETAPESPYRTTVVGGIAWTYSLVGDEAVIGGRITVPSYVTGAGITEEETFPGPGIPTETAGAVAVPAALDGYPVVSIGDSAFSGCASVTSVTIPEGITNIGQYAFEGCVKLSAIRFENHPPSGLANAGLATDISLSYDIAYADAWVSVIRTCGFTGATAYGSSYTAALDNSELTWTSGGAAPWTVVEDATRVGGSAVRSGEIDSGTTWIETTVVGPCAVVFNCRASTWFDKTASPQQGDWIEVFIDGASDSAWKTAGTMSYWMSSCGFRVESGAHTVRFSYTRSHDAGENCVWIDNVRVNQLDSHGVTFDLGTHGTRTGGGELSQTVVDGEAAVAPEFAVAEGWRFTGWSCDFSQVTDDLVVTAQYEKIEVKLPDGHGYTEKVGDYTWTFSIVNGNAEIGVRDANGNEKWECAVSPNPTGDLVVPDSLGGHPVVRLGPSALCRCGMAKVVLPTSLADIGAYAMQFCYGLTDVELPISVTNIGELAFWHCKMVEILIPQHVASIGSGAFRECWQLSGLAVDSKNERFESREGVLYDKGAREVYFWPCGKAMDFPETVRNIRAYACFENVAMQNETLEIPSSVTNIGESAFFGCKLGGVVLMEGLQSIALGAFGDNLLRQVTIPSSVISVEQNVFTGCAELTLVFFLGDAPSQYLDAFFYGYTPTNLTTYVRVGSLGWEATGSAALPLRWPQGVVWPQGGDCSRSIRHWTTYPEVSWRELSGLGTFEIATGGNADWFPISTGGGVCAMRSGEISDSQSSWMQTTVTGPCEVSFRWMVSSEVNNDRLGVYVDGDEQGAISGSRSWAEKTLTISKPGDAIVKWVYSKNASSSAGEDCGRVDALSVTPIATAPDAWTSDFTGAKQYADDAGAPLIVVWGGENCSYCDRFNDAVVGSADVTAWLSTNGYVTVLADSDDTAAKTFARDPSGKYPFVAIYWNKGEDGVAKWTFAGRDGTMPSKAGDLPAQFMRSVDAILASELHAVTFDLGEYGFLTGGELSQTVVDGEAAVAPEFAVAEGWRFTGWSCDFSQVTEDLIVTALYEEVADPVEFGGFAFESNEAWVDKGGAFELVVYGGSDEQATSVKLNASYVTAKASDLDLKKATVIGADGEAEQTNLKFPLTLSWEAGDLEPKTIVIPTTAGKKTDAPKYLTWNLSDAKGLDIAEFAYSIGTIAEGEDYKGSDVCVLPYLTDMAGGKVSGGASVAPDRSGKYKTVTLKATANKNYWFAGWFDADGEWVCSDFSFKVTPEGDSCSPMIYEARFTPALTSLVGTYSGYARVNLKGMTIVKGASVTNDVIGEYPLTATLSKDGKLSGSITAGGKKVAFKADACCEASETDDPEGWSSATYRFALDEKTWFGKANSEVLQIEFSRCGAEDSWTEYGVARLGGVSSPDDGFAPLGDEQSGFAYLNSAKADDALIRSFAGTYTACLTREDGVIPLSVGIDRSGKVKASGKFADGTALAMTGSLTYRYGNEVGGSIEDDPSEEALVHLFATPKSLGGGSLHVTFRIGRGTVSGVCVADTWCRMTEYAASGVRSSEESWGLAAPFSTGCWIPTDAELVDPDFGAVRLACGEEGGVETIDILYAAKNGTVTGLGSALQSGHVVKFDAKTGLFTVTKGKAWTIQGALGSYADGCRAAGRIDADGTRQSVSIGFVKLDVPDECFPWTGTNFSLTVGQVMSESPFVTSGGTPLALTISGLPAGLKYDKKTGLITGAPTKAGKSTVKVSYTYGTQKITRTTEFVVAAKPADLPVGTYAGTALVGIGGDYENTPVSYPFTATIDKKGALSGSITLFGKKATLKASGYDCRDEYGQFRYSATLDLKAVGKSWGTLPVTTLVTADMMDFWVSDSFGSDLILAGATAYRNQTKDSGFADRVKPYVGTYLVSLDTCSDDAALSGVSTLSIVVDKKGGAKLAGTFADGSAFSASGTLSLLQDGDIEWACLAVSVVPKSLAQGALDFSVRLSLETDEESGDRAVSVSCSASAAKYVLKDDAYTGYGLDESFAYAYSSLAWVDSYVRASSTCLSVTSDIGIFDEARYAWKTKTNPICGPEIVGVDKMIGGPKGMTFKLDDKTGFFSGTYAGGKFFGAMAKGACSGIGTAVGKDGSISRVTVGAAYRSE